MSLENESSAAERTTSRDATLSVVSRAVPRVPRQCDEDDKRYNDNDDDDNDDTVRSPHHACCIPAVIGAHVGPTIMTRVHDNRAQRGTVVAVA